MSLYAHHPTENSLGKCAPPPSLWHKLMSSFSTSRASLHAAADENTFWCSFEQNLATRSPNLCREHMILLAHRLDRPHDRSRHLEACPHTAVHHVHPDLYAAIFSATFVTAACVFALGMPSLAPSLANRAFSQASLIFLLITNDGDASPPFDSHFPRSSSSPLASRLLTLSTLYNMMRTTRAQAAKADCSLPVSTHVHFCFIFECNADARPQTPSVVNTSSSDSPSPLSSCSSFTSVSFPRILHHALFSHFKPARWSCHRSSHCHINGQWWRVGVCSDQRLHCLHRDR